MTESITLDVPPEVKETLDQLLDAARKSLGDNLCSVLLYGSAAEGRLRASSDVNLMFVLRSFDQAGIDPLREPLRLAHAAIRATAMFVLESELRDAGEAFASKFADIARRHVVLHGDDPAGAFEPSREALTRQLRQTLLNLSMRLRERYAMTSLREEQLARVVADASGPLRAAAASLLQLQGKSAASPKEALQAVTQMLGGSGWESVLQAISTARETGVLPPGSAAPLMFRLMDLARGMAGLVERLG